MKECDYCKTECHEDDKFCSLCRRRFIMKTIASVLLGLALLFTVGCKSPALTKGFVRTSVATGVGLQVLHEPKAIPYLRAAAPVVCSAAHGTNISPAEVVAALEASDASKLETPEARLIINGALSLYMTAFEEYGDDLQSRPLIVAILEGTCEGILLGLPPPTSISKANVLYINKPHVK